MATGWEAGSMVGHEHRVQALAFSPDGQRLVSGGADGKVILWDTVGGHIVRTWGKRGRAVASVAFSRDGKYISAGCQDGIVMVWDTATGREVHAFHGALYAVSSVAFNHNGSRLIGNGGGYRHAMVWKLNGE